MRLSLDKQLAYARQLLGQFSVQLGETLVQALLDADQSSEAGIHAQRQRVQVLKERLVGLDTPRPVTCAAWPRLWSRKASGSSAAMGGDMTSAMVGWTTCCPPATT